VERSVRAVTVGGQPLRVAVRPGDGTRTPLVLANGIGASLELLQPLVDALDPSLEVIRFDAPGVGGSPLPRLPYRLPHLARLVARLLDQLGYGSVDMLGISWGGGLAQQFALCHRDRCRRLVLVATATGTLMVPGRPRVLARMATPRRYLDPGYAERVAADLYGGTIRTDPGRARALLHDRTATSTSWPPAPAGAACRCCPSSGSRHCCWPATTTRSSRSSTPTSCGACCPTPSCTSTTVATWGCSPRRPSWPWWWTGS
jgi:poly(3-hydroxyalkanoate) depolymerase